MATQEKQRFGQFHWLEDFIEALFKCLSILAEPFLAFGLIASGIDYGMHGKFLANVALMNTWTITQGVALEGSGGVALAMSFEAAAQGDKVKSRCQRVLALSLLLVGGIMFFVEISQGALGGNESSMPPWYVYAMSALRAAVSLGYIAVCRTRKHRFSGVAPEIIEMRSMQDEVQGAMSAMKNEVQAWVQSLKAEVQGAVQGQVIEVLEGKVSEVQRTLHVHFVEEVQRLAALHLEDVQGAMHTQIAEVQGALSDALHARVTEVQGALTGEQAQSIAQLRGKLAEEVQGASQAQFPMLHHALHTELSSAIEAQLRSMDEAVVERFDGMRAELTEEVQGFVDRLLHHKVQTIITEVQASDRLALGAGQGATREPMTGPLHAVQGQGANEEGNAGTGFRDPIFAYVQDQLVQGATPSVKDVMVAVGCGERTAKTYRKQALDALVAVQAK